MEKLSFDVQEFELIDPDEGEEVSSVSLNPTFRWCKFILTDDKPNLNKKRIPIEEFDNLVRTGINTPIKMELSQIGDHADAIPLGVITALKKEENHIKGLAALWSEERPEDVALIRKNYVEGNPLNLSWEVLYSEMVDEDDEVKALKNTALRAATFVRLPAYAGRTPVLEVSSTDKGETSNVEDTELDELEQAKARIAELETQLGEKDGLLLGKDEEIAQLRTENESLASFKNQVEAEKASNEKLVSIKTKFTEAGITKTDEYFAENREKLLGMDELTLDFMIQELVSFASQLPKKPEDSSISLPQFPNDDKSSPRELGKKLRTQK